MTTKIIVKATGEEKYAMYAITSTGNKRYNIDGKFYTDKAFDALFTIKRDFCPVSINQIQRAIAKQENKYPFDYARTEDGKDSLHIMLIDPVKAAQSVYDLFYHQ